MDEPGDQPGHELILASDAEREHAVVTLRTAVVEGRLTLEEFTERVEQAQLARTNQDLETVTRHLPRPAVDAPQVPATESHRAVFSHLVRRGPWELARRSSFRSILGTIDLDLRGARLGGPETDIEVYNLFGTVTVIVPEGVVVVVDGGGLFASQIVDPPASQPVAGAPILRIHLSGPGGTLYVRNREPPSRVQRLLGTRTSS